MIHRNTNKRLSAAHIKSLNSISKMAHVLSLIVTEIDKHEKVIHLTKKVYPHFNSKSSRNEMLWTSRRKASSSDIKIKIE